ncbi:MAG: helix-turn-helix domain-containing protein [Candidatus Omnitrophica bacterium]|nr:helix-turn-helix domain-containing protein [Candidatus Omnitrophota bacterium]
MLPVGHQIYLERLRKGLTQAGLASACGIAQPNLSNIEKGKQDLTVSTLVRIAAALGVRPAEFIEDSVKTKSIPLTRKTIETIALAVVNPETRVSDEMRHLASLFREILPQMHSLGSSQKINAAWLELKNRFTSQEIHGICQRVEDARQRKS